MRLNIKTPVIVLPYTDLAAGNNAIHYAISLEINYVTFLLNKSLF